MPDGIHEPFLKPIGRYAKALNLHPNNHRLDAMRWALKTLIREHAHITHRPDLLIACAGVVGQISKHPGNPQNKRDALAWSSKWLSDQSKPLWWNLLGTGKLISQEEADREIRDLLTTYFPQHSGESCCT